MTRARDVVLALGVVLVLGACGGPDGPAVTVAPSASDPGCAALLGRLPQDVLGQPRGTSDVAGSAAWGDPAIVLRCGVAPPGPSSDRCIDVNDVHWLFTEDKNAYYFVTFGRTPAVELTVPTSVDRTSAPGALAQLSAAVAPLPVTDRCVNPDGT